MMLFLLFPSETNEALTPDLKHGSLSQAVSQTVCRAPTESDRANVRQALLPTLQDPVAASREIGQTDTDIAQPQPRARNSHVDYPSSSSLGHLLHLIGQEV